jgi:hypothetical protein
MVFLKNSHDVSIAHRHHLDKSQEQQFTLDIVKRRIVLKQTQSMKSDFLMQHSTRVIAMIETKISSEQKNSSDGKQINVVSCSKIERLFTPDRSI